MLSEIETKLEMSEEALERLLGSDLLGTPNNVLEQTATYFDTDDQSLQEAGFSLRIRRAGETRVQTVKASGPAASLFTRSEWESNIDDDEPVIDGLSPLQKEFGDGLEVSRLFDVNTERRLWTIDENASTIEVVADQGDVLSGNRCSPIREVELELKNGSLGDLLVFARKIDAVAPFKFGILSKSERGYALLEKQQTVFKAERIALDRSMDAVSAFQSIALSCFKQFRLNEDVLLAMRNPEALHQARVAIRRLRSAFSMFKSILPGDEPRRIKDEFRWLAGVLGEARNVDVLLAKAVDPDLRSQLKAIRTTMYNDALEALSGSRARALMLDFIDWLYCGEWLRQSGTTAEREKPALEFATTSLEKMRRRLKKDGRALAEVDDEHRHEVRKDAKKLRYGAEFFGSLFDDGSGPRRHKKFLSAMSEMQDHLGDLNDLATGPEVLDQHGLRDHPASDSVVPHGNKDKLIQQAQAAVDDVLDTKRFWI